MDNSVGIGKCSHHPAEKISRQAQLLLQSALIKRVSVAQNTRARRVTDTFAIARLRTDASKCAAR